MTTHNHRDVSSDLVPIGRAAQVLGVSVDTLRKWEREGKISASRTLGRQRRFALAEIERVRAEAAR